LQLADPTSNFALLEETYRILYPIIVAAEKKNENLLQAHDKYKEEV
jgi:hypothetical protein